MPLLDNYPAHPPPESLKSKAGKIVVIFLPKKYYCTYSTLGPRH
jgi:hypothetical protein